MHNLPDKIFTLAEQYNFSELSAAEKGLVLQHMSEEEYGVMHDGFTLAMSNVPTAQHDYADNKAIILDALIAKSNTVKLSAVKNIRIWQAAAAVLAVCTTSLCFNNFNKKILPNTASTKTILVHDTIVKNTPPSIITDTVYLTKVETKYLPTPSTSVNTNYAESTEKPSFVSDTFNKNYIDSLTQRIGFSEAEVGMGTF
jgi:hypothetical protein